MKNFVVDFHQLNFVAGVTGDPICRVIIHYKQDENRDLVGFTGDASDVFNSQPEFRAKAQKPAIRQTGGPILIGDTALDELGAPAVDNEKYKAWIF